MKLLIFNCSIFKGLSNLPTEKMTLTINHLFILMFGSCAPIPTALILRLKSTHTSTPGTNYVRWELQSQRQAGKLMVFYNELEIVSTSNFNIIRIILFKIILYFSETSNGFFCYVFCFYSYSKTYYESSFKSMISHFLRKINILMMK